MLKKVLAAALFLAFSFPLVAAAQELIDLQSQLRALLAQVTALQAQLDAKAVSAGITTAQQTAPLPIRFSVLPHTGVAPLTVTFSYLINEEKTCEKRNYVLNFGDETESKSGYFNKPLGICHSYRQYAQRTYAKPGTYHTSLVLADVPNVPNKNLGAATIIVTDPSNNLFVTAPNGGEQWKIGSMNTIMWNPYQQYPAVNPPKEVKAYLEQRLPDGSFYTLGEIGEKGSADIRTDMRVAPAEGEPFYPQVGEYYVRIMNLQTSWWDRSDAAFTLVSKD